MTNFPNANLLTREEAADLVERYGEAWVSQDPEALCDLFCEDGILFERPGKEVQGHQALGEYWKRTVVDRQKNIAFRHLAEELVFDPENLACTAKWEANFEVIKSFGDAKMSLVTVAVLRFRKNDIGLFKIETLEEYWHNAVPREERQRKGKGKGQGKSGTKGGHAGGNQNQVIKAMDKKPANERKNNRAGKGNNNNNMMEIDSGAGHAKQQRAQPKGGQAGNGGQTGKHGGKGGGGKKGGGKKGGGKEGGGKKGLPIDRTCWDFQKGNCKRGDSCKWQH